MQKSRKLLAAAFCAPLFLSACDGWVAQPYHGVPYDGKGVYDDERTAGSGVEWVRAAMLPSKGPETKPIIQPPPAPQAPAPVKSAEPLYNAAQEK